MAFKLSTDAQLVFFNKVFGPNSAVSTMAKALIDNKGVTFEVELHSVRAYVHGIKVDPLILSVGTTSLMKGTANPLVADQNRSLIVEWVSALYIAQGSPASKKDVAPTAATTDPNQPSKLVLTAIQQGQKLQVIKAIMKVTGFGLLDAKKLADHVTPADGIPTDVEVKTFPFHAAMSAAKVLASVGGHAHVEVLTEPVVTVKHAAAVKTEKTEWMKAQPIDKVIPLREAQALGQKVLGTSMGSVYYCIALNERVKVAARIYESGSISIRTEWQGEPSATPGLPGDLTLLEQSGVQLKGHYGSIHFDAAGVPVSRVVGAFLIGTGIKWQAMVTSGADIILTEKA